MISRLIGELTSLERIVLHPGLDRSSVDRLSHTVGVWIPDEHAEFLEAANGVEADSGYVRLFGLGNTESVDVARWNQDDFWKFAWCGRCSEYWCFAETCWGDQYAYSTRLLDDGKDTVYFLDACSMTPHIIADSFTDFVEGEFLQLAKSPYDDMTRQAREKFGPLGINTHLIYIPSLLLGGTEDIDHVQTMDARAAMICNGDIAVQIDAAVPGKVVTGVQPYKDDLHRMRLRLTWA